MRFKNILFFLTFFSMGALGVAQENVGNEMVQDGFFMKFALNFPTNTYSKIPGDLNPSRITSRRGLGLDLGKIWYLRKIPLGPHLTIGMDATFFSFSYSLLKGENKVDGVTGELIEDFDYRHFTFSTQMGFLLNTRISKDFSVDVGFKFAPTIDFFYRYHSPDSRYYDHISVLDGSGFLWIPSLLIRNRMMIIGLEYVMGSLSYTDYRVSNIPYGESAPRIYVPMNQFRVLLGVKF